MNVAVGTSVRVPAFTSFRYTPRSESARLYGHSIFNFLHLHSDLMHSYEEMPPWLQLNMKCPREREWEAPRDGMSSPGGKERLVFFGFHLVLLSVITPTLNANSIHILKSDFKPTKAGAEKNADSLGRIGGGRGPDNKLGSTALCPWKNESSNPGGDLGSIVRTHQILKENQVSVWKASPPHHCLHPPPQPLACMEGGQLLLEQKG